MAGFGELEDVAERFGAMTETFADVETAAAERDSHISATDLFTEPFMQAHTEHQTIEALVRNSPLDAWFVQNFNEDQTLPLGDGAFDAVLCALSVQYLQNPGAVFAEFARVLSSDGVLVVSFSSRMFPTKAVRAWRTAGMDERAELVASYCGTGGLAVSEVVRDQPEQDPFVAVVARAGG